jgi:hypothetical protein
MDCRLVDPIGANEVSQLNPRTVFRNVDRILLGLALLFGAALIVANAMCSRDSLRISDQFDPDLQSVRSVDAAVAYVKGTRSGTDPAAIADATDAFVRKRFVHGYSQFLPCEDWIAYLAGFVRTDLRNPVLPDDILNHRRGACSQQAIVFQAIARKLGLNVGSVRLTSHFISAVEIHGQWVVYDPDQEIAPKSYPLSSLLAGDPQIEKIYGDFGRKFEFARQGAAGQIHFGDVNSNPAPRASIFQRLTHFFSHYGWAVFLGLFVALNATRGLIADWRRRRVIEPHLKPVPF